MKVNTFTVEVTASNKSQKLSTSEVQIRNVLICQSDQELNDDDTDKKYLNMNYIDKLNVLTAVLHFDKWKDKVLSSTLEKRKRVVEE